MKLEHRFTVAAPVERTWAAFNDLDRVVPCFPGATLTSSAGDGFEGTCKVKLGPVSLLYTGSGRFTERDEAAYRLVAEAKGKDRRGNGTAAVSVTAVLTASGDAATDVEVDTDLSVTGKPAQFGRGLIQDVSDKLLAQFVECLGERLGEDTTAQPAGSESPEPDVLQAASATGGPDATSASPGSPPSSSQAAELDLGSALLPVLARRLVPYLIGAVVALLLRRVFSRLFGR
jgi:carbon monoxide dehydrogenase subunit G